MTNAHRERLIELEQRYTGRRTVESRMLREALSLIDGALAEREYQRDLADERVLEAHRLEIERAERRQANLERQHEADVAEIRRLKARLSNVQQTTEPDEDSVTVSFAAPTTDAGRHPRSWNVGELEDICHRLRVAGAEDFTQVEIKHKATTALVPFPELLPLRAGRPPATDDDGDMLPTNGESGPPPVRAWVAAAALLVALVVVVIATVII